MIVTAAEARFRSVERRRDAYAASEAAFRNVCAGPSAIEGLTESAARLVCFDLVELVDQGGELFDSINRLDNDWRALIFDEVLVYDEAFDERIRGLYRTWLEASEHVLEAVGWVEAIHPQAEPTRGSCARLASAVREVRGLLIEDKEFFGHEKLVELRDAAIDEFRADQTLES